MKLKRILEILGFKVQVNDLDYEVTVPTYRCTKDIKIKQDLIEEIARIYGLEKFVPKPLLLDLTPTLHENIFNDYYEVKRILASKFDMHEVHSYMWYDTNLLKELGVNKNNVKLLGKETNNILRDDMSFSLLNIVKENFKNYGSFKIFEIGTIIKDNLNKRVLSIIFAGEEKNLEKLYNEAKEVVSYLFKILKNMEVVITNNVNEQEYYDENLGKVIKVMDKNIGYINVLNRTCSNKLSKKKCVVTIDIDMDTYIEIPKENILAKEVSKFPTVSLDYTVIMNDKKYEFLNNILREFRSNLIKKYDLIGVYENKYTIRYVLGSDNKTLEQKDLQTFKERFIKYIKDNGLDILE